MSGDKVEYWFRGTNAWLGAHHYWPIHWKGVLLLAAFLAVAACSLASIDAGLISDNGIPLLLLVEAVPAYFGVRLFFDHLDWIETPPRRHSKSDLRDR